MSTGDPEQGDGESEDEDERGEMGGEVNEEIVRQCELEEAGARRGREIR